MNVILTKRQESFVRQELDAGAYETNSDVVAAGLDLLQHYKPQLDVNILQGITEAEAGLGEEFTSQVALDIAREIELAISQ
jgi:putative addiction module CopG family antidote